MIFLRLHFKLIFLNIVSALIFVLLSISVISGGADYFNNEVFNIFSLVRNESLTNVMVAISFVFDPIVLFVTSLLFFAILRLFKRRELSNFFLISLFLAILSGLVLKEIFALPRPLLPIELEWGYTFPSIHATASAVFFLTAVYAIERKIHDKVIAFLFATVSFGMVFLSGLSRLYLGAHWISDVAAGFALGLFWTTLGILFLKYREMTDNPPKNKAIL